MTKIHKIQVGDRVKVIDDGYLFPDWVEFAKVKGLDRWIMGWEPLADKSIIYKVILLEEIVQTDEVVVAIEESSKSRQYLIELSGLEFVDDGRNHNGEIYNEYNDSWGFGIL